MRISNPSHMILALLSVKRMKKRQKQMENKQRGMKRR